MAEQQLQNIEDDIFLQQQQPQDEHAVPLLQAAQPPPSRCGSHSSSELPLGSYSGSEAPDGGALSYQSTTSSELVGRCTICSDRRRRSHLVYICFALWAVPLALASSRVAGLWGGPHRPAVQTAKGRLLLAQVVFRHGARTPLSQAYFNTSSWRHCSQEPLEPAAAPHNSSSAASNSSSSSSASGIRLALFDASGGPSPPPLSGGNAPLLPGGCRMGALTDRGFKDALELGAALRSRYITSRQRLLPADAPRGLQHLSARATAVRRTVTTLRGVLTGLFPGASDVVRVGVLPPEREDLIGDAAGCTALGNLTAALNTRQARRDAHDTQLQELEARVRSSLHLPGTGPLAFVRLHDEYVCNVAEGQPPPAAAAQPHLMRRVDAAAMEHTMERMAPEPGHCLLGKQHEQQCKQVTGLTIGRLLHELLHNMHAAAADANATAAAGHQHHHNHRSANGSTSSSSGPRGRRLALAGGNRSLTPTAAHAGGNGSSDGGSSDAASRFGHLQLYAAHDTTLIPLLTALGQRQRAWPGFADYLAFELYEAEAGSFTVRVLHNGRPLALTSNTDGGVGLGLDLGGTTAADVAVGGGGGRNGRGSNDGGSSGVRGGAGVLLHGWRGFFHWLEGAAARAIDRAWEAASGAVSKAVQAWWQPAAGLVPNNTDALGTNGQGQYSRTAFVMSLAEFRHAVLGDYVVSPKQYASACEGADGGGGSGTGGGSGVLA